MFKKLDAPTNQIRLRDHGGRGRWVDRSLRVAGIGGGGGGSLSLDFTTGSLPDGVTFTRSTTAVDISGAAATTPFAIDAPRLSSNGIRIEPAHQNLVLYSTAMENAVWAGAGPGFTPTANSVVAPDGTTTATRFQCSGAAGTRQTVTIPGGTANLYHTVGCWMKAHGGTNQSVRLVSQQGGVSPVYSPDLTITPIWQFFTFQSTNGPETGDGTQQVGLWSDTSASAADIDVWGYRLIIPTDILTWTDPTSLAPVPTAASAVTCAADQLSFTVPAGVGSLTYTFDDDSTQTLAVDSGSYTVPTQLNRRQIKSIVSNAAITGASLAPVATATAIPDILGAYAYVNSRSRHVAAEPLTSIKIAVANWYVKESDLVETATGYGLNVAASIEYPVGTFSQVLFSGAALGLVPSGDTLFSDFTTVNIPEGATFWVRMYRYGSGTPTSVPFSQYGGTSDHTTAGEGIEVSASPGDLTMSGLISHAPDSLVRGAPAAIVGMTARRTFALVGDSRTEGVTDVNPTNSDMGEQARAIGAKGYAYINGGRGFDRFVKFVASNAKRRALFDLCSDVMIGYGINDLTLRTVDQICADLRTTLSYFPGKPLHLYTLTPAFTSSSDGWTTLNGQTFGNAFWRYGISYNNALRNGVPGATVYEVADAVSSARDSFKWRVDLGGPLTDDGLHANQLGNETIRDFLTPLLP